MKRTREQAYFNSYDFDAIEVLPYDEEGDEESETRSGDNPSRSATVTAAGITKFAYLQRLGAFFGHKEGATAATCAAGAAANEPGAAAAVAAAGVVAAGQSSDNFLLPRAMLKYQYQR